MYETNHFKVNAQEKRNFKVIQDKTSPKVLLQSRFNSIFYVDVNLCVARTGNRTNRCNYIQIYSIESLFRINTHSRARDRVYLYYGLPERPANERLVVDLSVYSDVMPRSYSLAPEAFLCASTLLCLHIGIPREPGYRSWRFVP